MKKILLPGFIIFGLVLIVFGVTNLLSSNDNDPKKLNKKTTNNMELQEVINLPEPVFSGEMSIEQGLKERRSHRNFSNKALSLQEVSQILWSAYGVSDAESFAGIKLKTAPSAGATYPLEIYLLAGNVDGLAPGLYKYHAEENKLELFLKGDIRKEVSEACLGQRMLNDAPATIIYNVVFERIAERYGDRGIERYVYMDIGHSSQNVYLQATALGMGTCAVGAFNDSQLEKVITPPEDEVVMYLMPFGYTN